MKNFVIMCFVIPSPGSTSINRLTTTDWQPIDVSTDGWYTTRDPSDCLYVRKLIIHETFCLHTAGDLGAQSKTITHLMKEFYKMRHACL